MGSTPIRLTTRLTGSYKPWIIGVLLAVVLVLAWDRFVLESIFVPSGSMEPTILTGERLLVWKWPSWISTTAKLNRFDIVVVKIPGKQHRYIKRIVGLPGERVVLREGYRVEINGKPLPLDNENLHPGLFRERDPEWGRNHIMQTMKVPGFETKFGKEPGYVLNENDYFVLGDNRWHSQDSRVFGPIPRKDIDGVAWRIWMSIDPCAVHKMRWHRVGMQLQ